MPSLQHPSHSHETTPEAYESSELNWPWGSLRKVTALPVVVDRPVLQGRESMSRTLLVPEVEPRHEMLGPRARPSAPFILLFRVPLGGYRDGS